MFSKDKFLKIIVNALPVFFMVGIIPVVSNDYILAGIYLLISLVSLTLFRQKRDWLFFIFGLFLMTFSEYLFISTGVEIFIRNSFLGLMPIWLPVLWAYSFVVIKRVMVLIGV